MGRRRASQNSRAVFCVNHMAGEVELAWKRDQPLVAKCITLLHMNHANEGLCIAYNEVREYIMNGSATLT